VSLVSLGEISFVLESFAAESFLSAVVEAAGESVDPLSFALDFPA